MSDTRYWSKEFMVEFIEEYKSHPCLWKIRSKEYTNKNLKNEAYEKLVIMCKNVYHEANRDFVVKKIQSLRGSFRKEIKKVEMSKRSGASIDDIYTPSLWYFDLFLFTKDQETPTDSISNMNDTEEIDHLEARGLGHEVDESLSEEPQPGDERERINNIESTQIINTTLNKRGNFQRGKKRSNMSTESKKFFDMCKTVLDSQTKSSNITEFEAVGFNIAKKLQKMQPTQAIFAESIINKVLTRGLLETLSDKTKLCDRSCSERFNSQYSTSGSSRPSSAFSYSSISQSSVDHPSVSQYTVLTTAETPQNRVIPNATYPDSNDTASSFYESSASFLNN